MKDSPLVVSNTPERSRSIIRAAGSVPEYRRQTMWAPHPYRAIREGVFVVHDRGQGKCPKLGILPERNPRFPGKASILKFLSLPVVNPPSVRVAYSVQRGCDTVLGPIRSKIRLVPDQRA